jgi:hypothetical protein
VLAFGIIGMVIHGYFRQKWGLSGHLSSTRGSYTSPHICFLAIDHILVFLVETISWTKIRRGLPSLLLKMVFHGYFRQKCGLCGHLSSTRGSFKNLYVLAFSIIENGHSWLFSTKMGVVWPLIIYQRLVNLTPHMFPCHR